MLDLAVGLFLHQLPILVGSLPRTAPCCLAGAGIDLCRRGILGLANFKKPGSVTGSENPLALNSLCSLSESLLDNGLLLTSGSIFLVVNRPLVLPAPMVFNGSPLSTCVPTSGGLQTALVSARIQWQFGDGLVDTLGCLKIGRVLNDSRPLLHFFCDARGYFSGHTMLFALHMPLHFVRPYRMPALFTHNNLPLWQMVEMLNTNAIACSSIWYNN